MMSSMTKRTATRWAVQCRQQVAGTAGWTGGLANTLGEPRLAAASSGRWCCGRLQRPARLLLIDPSLDYRHNVWSPALAASCRTPAWELGPVDLGAVRDEVRDEERGREEDQAEDEVSDEAVALSASDTGGPERDCDPDDGHGRIPFAFVQNAHSCCRTAAVAPTTVAVATAAVISLHIHSCGITRMGSRPAEDGRRPRGRMLAGLVPVAAVTGPSRSPHDDTVGLLGLIGASCSA